MGKFAASRSFRERFNISRLAIAYPWLTLGFWIAVTVAGMLAFSSLKYALFPDITFPVVVVNATAPLTAALDTESQITQPLEKQLQSLPGLDEIRSTTYPGQTVVSLAFAVGTHLEAAQSQVNAAVKRLKLPAGATLQVVPLNLNEAAVVSYAITSPTQTLAQLVPIAQQQIVPAIAQLPGVLKVELLGIPSAPVPEPPATQAPATQAPATQAPTTQAPAINAAETHAAGTAVRFNGQDGLAMQVIKRGNANALEVASQVEKALHGRNFPGVTLTLAATQADYIREATQATIDALGLAIALSVLVIFPFLWSWQATLISALAIPTSLLGTFIVMAAFGFNLETITLLALALIIGIIVDDAIVDVENIARHLEAGESPRYAAIAATNEIGLTVTAATLTIVAVFLPVGLMDGVVGQFFKPFGITVSAAVIVSLLVARTLSPLLAVRWLKPRRSAPHPSPSFEKWAEKKTEKSPEKTRLWERFTSIYYSALEWALHHRRWVLSLAIFSLVLGIGLIPLIPKGFIPKLDRGDFNIRYTIPLSIDPRLMNRQPGGDAATPDGGSPPTTPPATPPATPSATPPATPSATPPENPLRDSLAVAKQLEDFVQRSPQVQTVFTIVGSRQGAPNQGTLYVKLKGDRTQSTTQLQDQFRQQLPKLPGVVTRIEDIQFVDTGDEQPLQITLQGQDLKALTQTAQAIKAHIQTLPGLVEIMATGDGRPPRPSQPSSSDLKPADLKPADLKPADPKPPDLEPSEIEHLDSQRVAYVRANLSQDAAIGDATDLAVTIAKTLLPPGIVIDLGGDSARIGDIFGSFGVTLALSVGCILVVLLLLFRNWADPLVIAFSLPLSLAGAMVAIWAMGRPFGMISVIGIIFLLGLTNKNAILIVDYINQLRQSGMPRTAAILTAAPIRLRPILMTTSATILGMLPIALGWGAGAELRAPMAIAIIGGLVASTLLSLLVVPVVYAVLDDLPIFRRRYQKPDQAPNQAPNQAQELRP